MRTIRAPPVPPKRGPHDTIAGLPSQIWWALAVISSHSYAPNHGPIQAIRTSTVPSTTGSHESIGADSNMLIRTIRCTPCPAKMGASRYHCRSASQNLMSPCGDIVVWLYYWAWAYTSYLRALCPSKMGPSQYHRQLTSPNLMSPYSDIIVWLCSRPWAHANFSHVPCLAKTRS